MILRRFRLCVLGAVLAGLTAPALAGAAAEPKAAPNDSNVRNDHPRRVEVPFPLDVRTPESEQRASAPREAVREESGPHPFRESLFKRAALTGPDSTTTEIRARLSRHSDFS